MSRKNRKKKKNQNKKKIRTFALSSEKKKIILGILTWLIALIFIFGFFKKAGIIGRVTVQAFDFLIGKTVFFIPAILLFLGFLFWRTKYERFLLPITVAVLLIIIGISGIFGALSREEEKLDGGKVGYFLNLILLKALGFWVTQIIFLAFIAFGGLIIFQLLEVEKIEEEERAEKSFFQRVFGKKTIPPHFEVKEIEPESRKIQTVPVELKVKSLEPPLIIKGFKSPPSNLLASEKERPSSGDTRQAAAIIKKTLENFGIPVEMSEVNIGPTVTQYTLKPAAGIKLSRISALASNLALVLAAHPIRIEAPIPGKSLVGIEVPNKIRAKVRLRNLIENPNFKNSPSNLMFCLGKDVSGYPVYADLARMPHLLVAGSTGTGKTIFLNSLILSLLYKNSPQTLRLILVDPKRVEFPVYNNLPHLLCPVVLDVNQTISALKWTVLEMERRFEVLAEANKRDITAYNADIFGKEELMPYLILVVDELADLMAARGKEVEAGIVRLAQLSRAVGIHLVIATQRPSVEVITGLIKANITSRVTFQVASQIDSRTIIDMAGAEKLLGLGDMLFISAEVVKPKRLQGSYISEKEVKRVVKWMEKEYGEFETDQDLEEEILQKPDSSQQDFGINSSEDPLYEDAKRVIIQARKASASLLQRRLRIGYARAARLIDMLEAEGIVGPLDGSKPREVYIQEEED